VHFLVHFINFESVNAFILKMFEQMLLISHKLLMIITFFLSIIIQLPYYDKLLLIQELYPLILIQFRGFKIVIMLQKIMHFIVLNYVFLVVTILHINLNKYQLNYYYFFISITIIRHFVNTLRLFDVFQFFCNDTHNYYRSLLFV
jgi:hypothetical protein